MYSKNYKEYVQRVKEVVEISLLDDDGDSAMNWVEKKDQIIGKHDFLSQAYCIE